MMAGIDGAQSTEDLINALRGNEMTLGDRREELAEYVGQSDADKTPESVLALVQPVIMMTEEGMMNSGIGALVQQIAGDVDMATEGGQPTDMGMGVGSLMMAGAQEAPAPQNFRQGGEVAYLQSGTPKTGFDRLLSQAGAAYEKLTPLFMELIDQEERKQSDKEYLDFLKTQAALSAAQGGLRLAAGVPDAGSSFASQVGAAFADTAADLGSIGALAQARKERQRKDERDLSTAALQAGLGVAQTERAAEIASSAADLDFARDIALEQIKSGGLGTGQQTREDRFLIDNADAFADGTLSEKDLATFETIVSREYITPASTPVFMPGKGFVIPEISVPQFLIDANQKRIDKGLSGFNLEGSAQKGPAGARTDVENLPKPTLSTEYPGEGGLPEGAEVLPRSVAYEEMQKAVDTANLGDTFGTGAAIGNAMNKFFGIFEMGVPNQALETYLNTYEVNRRKAVIAQMTALEGRQSQEFFNQEYAVYPEPAAFFTPDSAAESKLRAIVAGLRQDIATAKQKLSDPVIAGDQAALKKQRQGIADLESALGFWGRFYNDLAKDIGSSIPSDADIADIVKQVREQRGL